LSALIDRVRGGDSVLIVDRGIPVARLESAVGAETEADEHREEVSSGAALVALQRLDARREGLVVRGDGGGEN